MDTGEFSRFGGKLGVKYSQMDMNRIQSLINKSSESFAEALKEARGERSIVSLCADLPFSKSAWYRWESGETLPEHRDDIEVICNALGCSLQVRMRIFRAYFRDLVRFALHKAGVDDDEGGLE